jgi:phytoene dehydrogenase-like protein
VGTGKVDADIIVVGGGHNGLICAAYLARSGHDTLLVEARDAVGGCASTVDALGARFNICNCDHTLIRAMPVIDDLDLSGHGLTYLEGDASYLHMFHDETSPWLFFSDQQKTLDGLSVSHPHQVKPYQRYLDEVMPVAELVLDMTRSRTTLAAMAKTAIGRRANGVATLLKWSRMSALDVLTSYFDDWHMVLPAISAGPTVWGAPPETPGTGMAALGYATRHLIRTGRPEGGSGALTDAVAASFAAAGGRTKTSAIVTKLLVKDDAVAGVELTNGERLSAGIVVTACDPNQVMLEWLDEMPAAARKTQKRYRDQPIHDGYESKIDAVIGDRSALMGMEALQERFPTTDMLEPTVIVSPSLDELAAAHKLRADGRVAENPTILMNIPSVLDPTMRSQDGRHILSLEILFTPYSLPGGWPASDEPRRWFDVANKFWNPAIEPADHEWRAMTPDIYESDFHMPRGHAPSYAASPLATLLGKSPEVSRYRSPIKGLYLSGAGTWPGAGIFGAPGRNAADAVLTDLRKTKRR